MEVRDAARSILGEFQKRLMRYTMLLIAVGMSVAGYVYVVEIYDPTKNLIRQVWRSFVNTSYDFYSGGEGGFYLEIGNLLQDSTKGDSGIKFLNHPTVGGVDNVIRVASSGLSFGLAQEDSIPEGDFLLDHIKFATPLYLEHMHVLYRESRVSELLGIDESDLPDLIEIFPAKHGQGVSRSGSGAESLGGSNENGGSSISGRQIARRFFERATVSTGPHRSGSRIIASYLLSEMGVSVKLDLNLGLQEAVDKLVKEEESGEDGLDVVLWIAGGPLDNVAQTLKEHPGIKLMSINPVFVPNMNKRFGLKLRPATFRQVYDGGEEVATIGSYSFLIYSKDVPDFAVIELLEILEANKHKIQPSDNSKESQLEQFEFLGFFRKKHMSFLMDLFRNLFIFASSVTLTTSGVMAFLLWLVSNLKQIGYFREITYIYKEYLPDNTALDESFEPFPKPAVTPNNLTISRLVEGTRRLLGMARTIRGDYRAGGVTSNHQSHLLTTVNHLVDIFQRNLFQRLSEYIQADEVNLNSVSEVDIRHFHTAGYLKVDHYRELTREYREVTQRARSAD